MDVAHEILLSSLKSTGISLPAGVSSIRNISPNTLVSICVQSLRFINYSPQPSFPTSLPPATAERFKICAEVASAIKSLGYGGELSFHQFLYPSDEESYKLVRFLVERLSDESSEGIQLNKRLSSCGSENSRSSDKYNSCKEESSLDRCGGDNDFITESERHLSLQQGHVSKFKNEIKELKKQEKRLKDEVHAKTLNVQKIQDKCDIMKVSLDLAVNSQQSVELYMQELDAKVKIRQQEVMELETKRNVAELLLNEKRESLLQSSYSEQSKVQEKLIQLKEIEKETEVTLAELSKREAENLDLLIDLEKQPKLPSRKSYIERITEVTKNVRKLDADIQQILKETRELQFDSNSTQERLHRTHAVVDETVFREAKKDAVGRQAYRLLTSIHDSFQQIAETILATDRVRREAAALEAKLATFSSHGFDIAKLQADLDSIRKENEVLGQKSHHSLPISGPL